MSGKAINTKTISCRDGDLLAFWTITSLAHDIINWQPKFNIETMCIDTWRWHVNNLEGYNS